MGWSMTLWGMAIGVLFSFLSFGSVIFFVDPEATGRIGEALLFSTLFLLFFGILSLSLLVVRAVAFGKNRALLCLGRSFRQGFLGALFSLGIVALFMNRWLVWWDALFLFVFFLLIELYFFRAFRTKTDAEL